MQGRPRPAPVDVWPGPADYQKLEQAGKDAPAFTLLGRCVTQRGRDWSLSRNVPGCLALPAAQVNGYRPPVIYWQWLLAMALLRTMWASVSALLHSACHDDSAQHVMHACHALQRVTL